MSEAKSHVAALPDQLQSSNAQPLGPDSSCSSADFTAESKVTWQDQPAPKIDDVATTQTMEDGGAPSSPDAPPVAGAEVRRGAVQLADTEGFESDGSAKSYADDRSKIPAQVERPPVQDINAHDLWNAVPAKWAPARRNPSRPPSRGASMAAPSMPNMVFSFVDQVSDSISSYLVDLDRERSQKEDLRQAIFERKVIVYDRQEKAEHERWNGVMPEVQGRQALNTTSEDTLFQCRPPQNLFFEEPKYVEDSKCLSFSSSFECGNLEIAGCERRGSYSLLLAHDVNTQGYTHWFYFAVKGGTVGQSVTFNILNMSKAKSLFEGGRMSPVVWSEKAGRCWERGGKNVHYHGNRHRQCSNAVGERARTYRTLSFTYTFEHDDDVVFFAYHYPYTYSHLQTFLDYLCSRSFASSFIQRRSTLCRTIGDLHCEALEIGETDLDLMAEKHVVVVTARVHPGEANSSWMMQGFLQFLCSDAEEASALRRNRVWLVVPMLNPDGVVLGNYRCGLAGVDLNRCFLQPDRRLQPEVWSLKERLNNCIVDAYLDLHGHSKKEGVFFYGGRCFDGVDMASSNVEIKLLPWLCAQASTDFKYKECRFAVEPSKRCTARLTAFAQLGVRHAYTVEASFAGPGGGEVLSGGHAAGEDFSPSRLALVGPTIARALLAVWQASPTGPSASGYSSLPSSLPVSRQGSKDSGASVNLFDGREESQWTHLQYSKLTALAAKEGLRDLMELEHEGTGDAMNKGEDSGSDSNPEADRATAEELKAIQRKLIAKLKRRRRQEEAEGVKVPSKEQSFRTVIAFGKSMRVPLRESVAVPSTPSATTPTKPRARTLENLEDKQQQQQQLKGTFLSSRTMETFEDNTRSPAGPRRSSDQAFPEKPARRRRQSGASSASTPAQAPRDESVDADLLDVNSSQPVGHWRALCPSKVNLPRNPSSEEMEVLHAVEAAPSAHVVDAMEAPTVHAPTAPIYVPTEEAGTPHVVETSPLKVVGGSELGHAARPKQLQPHLLAEHLKSRVHILPRSPSQSSAMAVNASDRVATPRDQTTSTADVVQPHTPTEPGCTATQDAHAFRQQSPGGAALSAERPRTACLGGAPQCRPMSAQGWDSRGGDGACTPSKRQASCRLGVRIADTPNGSTSCSDWESELNLPRPLGNFDRRPVTSEGRPHRPAVIPSRQHLGTEVWNLPIQSPTRSSTSGSSGVAQVVIGRPTHPGPSRGKGVRQRPALLGRDVHIARATTPNGRPMSMLGVAAAGGLRMSQPVSNVARRRSEEVNAATTWCRVLRTTRDQARRSGGSKQHVAEGDKGCTGHGGHDMSSPM